MLPGRFPNGVYACFNLQVSDIAVASYGRELLQDSGFKLVKPIKFLEVDNDLVFFS